jgi:phosphoribosylformylglycinamidine synthase subunit PurSL
MPDTRVHRFEVRAKPGVEDPRARAVERQTRGIGLPIRSVRTARIYLIEGQLDLTQLSQVRDNLLADPVTELATEGASKPDGGSIIEVHPLPGVMDPAAQSVREAIRDLTGIEPAVSTGIRYDLAGASPEQAADLAARVLANPVVHRVHAGPFLPDQLPRGKAYQFALRHIPIRRLTDDQLTRLSREAHLFLSLDEMKAIQAEYQRQGREPTDIELETLAQTWSEHCVHKTLKSKIVYRQSWDTSENDPINWSSRIGEVMAVPEGTSDSDAPSGNRTGHSMVAIADAAPHDPRQGIEVHIDNLLRSTVARATHELIAEGVDWTLSVFKDNAGVIAFDDNHAVCIKVETHNHPSAIEPYGGAATGAGGCIRDVIGTGLSAKPIANTDVFCVASPKQQSLPPGTLHPRRVLTDVVSGVRDYGNRMGIPTLNGAVYFDDRYIGNPLVFCGCIGLMPRHKIKGAAQPGDRIIALGGRTGRDGIHGATFSSAELEGTSADEFSHAVQIGNAIEEKRVLDAILRARDEGQLFNGITDCGAGGFSSAVGEMGSKIGAEVHLERAPLKYNGLSYTEIWISEAQERMVLAVPPASVAALQRVCDEEGVELADLGTFGTPTREIILNYKGHEVGRLDTHFLHEGIPQPVREAVWEGTEARRHEGMKAKAVEGTKGVHSASPTSSLRPSVPSSLLSLLSHPNIASKHWIIRQYDHEVQGNTIAKPLVGPASRGPGNAAVLEPVPGTGRGIAIACGLQTGVGDPAVGGDPYLMALAAIDECVRNLVCVGADPSRIAILDNFCWPSCAKPENLAALVRAAEGCYDGAKAYRTPFVSGKDSLNNQLKYTDAEGRERVIEIPPTLLITGLGIVPDIKRCVSMDAKRPGNILLLVGKTTDAMGGSHYQRLADSAGTRPPVPTTDLVAGPQTARLIADLISKGLIAAAHDVSDGGLLVAVSEMLIAAPGLGASIDLSAVHADQLAAAFSESPSRYLIEVAPADLAKVLHLAGNSGVTEVGRLNESGRLAWKSQGLDSKTEDLAAAWLSPLDW